MTITEVQSRISEIQSRLTALAAPTITRSAATGASFAQALATAQADGTTAAGAAGSGVTGDDVVAAAKKYLGVPYVFGGTNPKTGLDCSGLVQRVYKDLGIDLPRLVRDQRHEGTAVPNLAAAKPGDLLIFEGYQHIGIYLGNNKMLHAPQPGENVKIGSVYERPTSIRRIVTDSPLGAGFNAASVAALAGGGLSGVPFAAQFTASAKRHGLPPALLAAVAKVESNYNPNAVSPAGARGLMQFMPATARGYGIDPMNPTQAIEGAARKLAADLKAFGSVSLALAAYNAGAGAVRQHGGIPPYAETQAYVPKVLAAMSRIERGGAR
ncbi:MAG TPA: transglycosylase SLT domain-containing protein [Mycobacteriales bacterium]